MSGRLAGLRVLALGALALAGCGARGFRVHGVLASEGGALGTWRWQPQGCIRAAPGGEAVASLLWIDPVRRDPSRGNGHQLTVADAPVRLDLSRVGGEPIAVLETVRTRGTEFNLRNCRTLTLETQEERAPAAGGRPALGGILRMDCEVQSSRVTAEIQFRGCDY